MNQDNTGTPDLSKTEAQYSIVPGIDSRELRAIALAETGGIKSLGAGVFQSPSQVNFGAFYQLEFFPETKLISCSCPDYAARRQTYCKHGKALLRATKAAGYSNLKEVPPGELPRVEVGLYANFGNIELYKNSRRQPPVVIDFPTGPKERTRRFHAYDAMETRVPQLCVELLKPHVKPRVQLRGGQKLLTHDRSFTVLHRTFVNKPLHYVARALAKQAEYGRIEWGPRPNAISEYIHDPEMTPILEACLARSARPVRHLEEIVCVDSSGYSTIWSGNYLDNDRGKRERMRAQWIKTHIISGAKTNIVSAIEVTWNKKGIRSDDETEKTADVNHFVSLVKAMKQVGWKPKYAAADKAYLSDSNVDGALKLDVLAVIQMKVNSKRIGKTQAYKDLYDFVTDHPEAHQAIYRYRSKVESVFSSVKRTCGHYIWARGPRLPKNATEDDYLKVDVARYNEVLAKYIIHNLRQTVMLEHLHDERVDYAADLAFTPLPEEWKRIVEIREETELDEKRALEDGSFETGT